jgi:hypothetical protein
LGVADLDEGGAKVGEQCLLGVGTAVGECAFRVAPDAFVWVQLGRVRRQCLEVEAGKGRAQRPDGWPLVAVAIVPDHDHGSAEMTEDLAEESTHLGGMEVVVVELEIEAEVASLGTDRDTGDRGDPLVALRVTEAGSLATRRPGTPHAGDEKEAGFVYEDEVGAQPCCFILIRGHSSRFHFSIAASLRWSARRSGFCGLHPIAWSIRPMWSGW